MLVHHRLKTAVLYNNIQNELQQLKFIIASLVPCSFETSAQHHIMDIARLESYATGAEKAGLF